jgi:hypothetical protein
MILAKQPVYCAIRQFLAPRLATVVIEVEMPDLGSGAYGGPIERR